MARLPLTDAAWLLLENRERPMHVGGLQLFTRPADAPPDWLQQVAVEAMGHDQPRPPFDLVLKEPYGRFGTFAFEHDDVEIAYHVRHLALPAPGRIRELLSFCSNVHAQTLDRHRPLWELYLIEGIEGDRVAVFTKIHHSLLDGVAAMRQVLRAFTEDPDDRSVPPPWAMRPEDEPGRPTLRPTPTSPRGRLELAREGMAAIAGAGRALRDQYRQSRASEAEVVPWQAPRTMLNVPLTATRRFVAQDYHLDRLRAVATATGSTINDVALAMCSGALRTYLQQHDGLPDEPLVAMVPVSIRPADGVDEHGRPVPTDHGNALSFAMCNLATHLPDPGERLALIRASMDAAKARMRSMTRAELTNYAITITSPLVLGNLTGLSKRTRPLFNVTISNVPGPSNTLYWNGAELQGMYPASLLQDGYALNITQTSYRDQMAFGITADRAAVPHVQRMIDHLEDELVALERLGA